MISPVYGEGYAITCSQIFMIRLKRYLLVTKTERGYLANTAYIRAIGFSYSFASPISDF